MGAAVCTARRSFESTARQSQQQDGSNLKPNNYAAAACTRRTTVSVLRESVTSPDATTFPVTLISSPSAFELHLPSTTFFCRIGSESLDFLSPQFEILMQFPFHLLVTWGACSSSVFQFQVIPKGGLVVESSSVGSTLQINLQCSEPILLSKALDASTALFIAETEAMCLEVPSILLLKSDLTTSDGQIDREFTDIIRYHCDQSRRSFSIKQGTLLF